MPFLPDVLHELPHIIIIRQQVMGIPACTLGAWFMFQDMRCTGSPVQAQLLNQRKVRVLCAASQSHLQAFM